jgi:ribosomal protein S18 acetylase RimI-like enzyme
MLVLVERASDAIVGVAELSQQPRDGKVPGDVRPPRLPWTSAPEYPRVAYLSNLAVRTDYRSRGLGRSLIGAVESLARRWGFEEIYLHAATQQERLLAMYGALSYQQLPDFDQPPWVLAFSGREPTRYHCKALPPPSEG